MANKIENGISSKTGRFWMITPYHPEFAASARALKGSFESFKNHGPNSKAWFFDARDRERVIALADRIFGEHGEPVERVDLTMTATKDGSTTDCRLDFCGRIVATVRGRDSGAIVDVPLLAGRFESGGSVKYPELKWRAGTCFELRDVPRAFAEREGNAWQGFTGVTRATVAGTTAAPVLVRDIATLTDEEIATTLASLTAEQARRSSAGK